MLENPVIAEWAESPIVTRQIAAKLASDLAAAPPHGQVDSVRKIAERFRVSGSVATNVRNSLMGQGIIYKVGRHYYVAGLTEEHEDPCKQQRRERHPRDALQSSPNSGVPQRRATAREPPENRQHPEHRTTSGCRD